MTRGPQVAATVLALALLAGCTGRGAGIPTERVAVETFQVRVPARGVLQAEQSTPIVAPQIYAPMTVSWFADDGAAVKEGDVVARLDEKEVQDDLTAARDEVRKLDLEIEIKKREQEDQQRQLTGEIEELEQQRKLAKNFAPRDPEIFSKNDIIDSEISQEGLEAKAKIYDGKKERQHRKQQADLELLQLKRKTQEVKIDQLVSSQTSLEVKAPHAGIFLQGRSWRGDLYRVGMTIWPGWELGKIPELSKMEAKVNVLESEAAGVAVGQSAEVRIDAAPGRTFAAKVKTVEAVAQALDNNSPVKYFQVVLSLDHTDPLVMRPGREVRGTILAQRSTGVISIPNQALFHKGEENWVFVRDGGGFVRRLLQLGQRSLTRTVVRSGLTAGEEIALADPGRS